jgi:hypothetical protein
MMDGSQHEATMMLVLWEARDTWDTSLVQTFYHAFELH